MVNSQEGETQVRPHDERMPFGDEESAPVNEQASEIAGGEIEELQQLAALESAKDSLTKIDGLLSELQGNTEYEALLVELKESRNTLLLTLEKISNLENNIYTLAHSETASLKEKYYQIIYKQRDVINDVMESSLPVLTETVNTGDQTVEEEDVEVDSNGLPVLRDTEGVEQLYEKQVIGDNGEVYTQVETNPYLITQQEPAAEQSGRQVNPRPELPEEDLEQVETLKKIDGAVNDVITLEQDGVATNEQPEQPEELVENTAVEVVPDEAAEVEADEDKEPLSEEELAFRESREKWYESRIAYMAAKKDYENAVREYHEKGLVGRALQSVRNLIDNDLKHKEAAFKKARLSYAKNIQTVFTKRSAARENFEFDKDADETRNAFALKLIIRPRAKIEKIKQENTLDPETLERFNKIKSTLKNHKSTIRVGTVVATGFWVGSGAGLAAGAAAGTYKLLRIALGAVGGVAGAQGGEKIGNKLIDTEKDEAAVATAKENLERKFTFEGLDLLERELEKAERELRIGKRIKKGLVVGGAIVGGGGLAMSPDLFNFGGARAAVEQAALTPEAADEALNKVADIINGDHALRTPTNIDAIDAKTGPVQTHAAGAEPGLPDSEAISASEEPTESSAWGGETTPRPDTPETLPHDHTIVQGDNLWNITKSAYAHKLDGLSSGEKNIVLDSVFDEVRGNPELIKDLGVKADIDKIYPGDNLKVSSLNDLIDKHIKALSDNPIRTTSTVSGTNISTAESVPSHITKPEVPVEELAPGQFTGTTQFDSEGAPVEELRPGQTSRPFVQPERAPVSDLTPRELDHTDWNRPPGADIRMADGSGVEGQVDHSVDGHSHILKQDVTIERNAEGVMTTYGVKTESIQGVPAHETHAGIPDYANRAPVDDLEPRILDQQLEQIAAKLGLPSDLVEDAIDKFGSVEQFKAAKFAAIEDIAGKQPPSLLGGERFEPVFEKIKSIPLLGKTLPDGTELPGMQDLISMNEVEKTNFLMQLGMQMDEEMPRNSNMTTLNAWVDQYEKMTSKLARTGLVQAIRDGTTLDEMFTNYVISLKK